MLRVSHDKIPGHLADIDQPPGRSQDYPLTRTRGQFELMEPFAIPTAHTWFLSILSTIVPTEFDCGTTFYRALGPGECALNETHRDKGNELVMNATALVCPSVVSYQLEFFSDDDVWEQNPTITPNGYVLVFQKDLHRRPARGFVTVPRLFISANVFRQG